MSSVPHGHSVCQLPGDSEHTCQALNSLGTVLSLLASLCPISAHISHPVLLYALKGLYLCHVPGSEESGVPVFMWVADASVVGVVQGIGLLGEGLCVLWVWG